MSTQSFHLEISAYLIWKYAVESSLLPFTDLEMDWLLCNEKQVASIDQG